MSDKLPDEVVDRIRAEVLAEDEIGGSAGAGAAGLAGSRPPHWPAGRGGAAEGRLSQPGEPGEDVPPGTGQRDHDAAAVTGDDDAPDGAGLHGDQGQEGGRDTGGQSWAANWLTAGEEEYRHRAYEAARHYAADYGLKILPLWHVRNGVCQCPAGKSCPGPGKHPRDRDWPAVATSDPDRAARWWRPPPAETLPVDWRPQANIGAMMGERHALVDVDTDAGKVGDLSMETLLTHHGEDDLPVTLMWRTGGGGSQHVFLVPEGVEVRNSASRLAPDVDVRGLHGFGILPPSVSGKGSYQMLNDLPPAPAPLWLADWWRDEQERRTSRPRPAGARPLPARLSPRARAYVAGALTQAAEKLATASARNNTLNEQVFALASRFGSAGLLEFDDVVTVMWDGAEQCGVAQEESAKTRATLERAWRDGLAKPSSDSLPEFMFQEERPPSRHVLAPRLRVSPPARLGEHADAVLRAQIAAVAAEVDAARPQDEESQSPDHKCWASAVEQAGAVLGRLGDEDLIDWGAARDAIIRAASPADLIESMTAGMNASAAKEEIAAYHQWVTDTFTKGWNEGAETGYEMPAELRADLDAWHPPCPIPHDQVEPHRLPPGREGAWPARNMVSKSDDRGNAERLLDHFGGRILFLDDKHLGECAFDGVRWKLPDDGGPGLVRQYASETIGRLPVTEALSYSAAIWYKHTRSGLVATSNRDEYFELLNAQQSAGTVNAMISLAKADPGHRVSPDVFDADPRWLNLPNGELDLGAAEMRPDGTWKVIAEIRFHAAHFAEHHHHRVTRAVYDPAAQCPEWRQAMNDWLPDEESRRFLQKLVGAAARGLITIKALVVLLGGGDSGKTTFIMVIAYVLGTYAITAQASILRKSRQGSLSDDINDLKGGRLITTAETSGGEEMDAPKIKRLSGGDTQRSRGLYSSSGEWLPRGLLFFTTNEMMYIPAADRPLWNRIRPVRFPNTFSESGTDSGGNPCRRADPNMKDRLLDEAPGILNWVIEGLQLLYTEGLGEPAAVAAERERLRGEQNTVATFLAEAGVVALASEEPVLDDKITLTRVFRHYKQWADASHVPAVGRIVFRQTLAGIGGVSFTTSGRVETVHGIGHTSKADLYMPAEGWCQVCRGKAGTGLTLTDLEGLADEHAHRRR